MDKIQGSKVLVTGGAGFIGSNLVDRLLLEGAKKVIVVDDLSRGKRENLRGAGRSDRFQFVKGSILDKKLLRKLTVGANYVFHEAVIRVTHAQDDPRLGHEVIADGSFNILEACAINKVKKVVVSSSTTVYGEPVAVPIVENHPLLTRTFYGVAKAYVELLSRAFYDVYKLKTVYIRPFNVYGPRVDITSKYQEVIPLWVNTILAGERPTIHGKGLEIYDFTYVDDIINASILALTHGKNGGIYNAGTGQGTSLNNLASIISGLLGRDDLKPIHVNPGNRPRVTRRVADTSLAQKELKFKAKVKLKDGLKEFIAWRRNEN